MLEIHYLAAIGKAEEQLTVDVNMDDSSGESSEDSSDSSEDDSDESVEEGEIL